MRRHLDFQSICRLLVIPWFIVFAIIGDMANYEAFGHVEFVNWLNTDDDGVYVHYLDLKKNHPYRLVIFTQKRNLFDRDIMLAESEIKNSDGKVVAASDYSHDGKVLNAVSLTRLLGKHASELFDDKEQDPYTHNKFIRSTRIFEVDRDGVYTVNTRIIKSVDSWRMALLVNVKPDDKWVYLLMLVALYAPFFVLQELYFFVKRKFGSK